MLLITQMLMVTLMEMLLHLFKRAHYLYLRDMFLTLLIVTTQMQQLILVQQKFVTVPMMIAMVQLTKVFNLLSTLM